MNHQDIKIIFMGTPDFAVPAVQKLIENYNVIAVFTAPDRPSGRGRQIKLSPIKELALKNNIPIFQPVRIKHQKWIDIIKRLSPDLAIVAAFGQIIPQSILDIPPHGFINIHASLLPRHRGASPIHYSLLSGDSETGITIMQMDAGMDTGAILSQESIDINLSDNLTTLHDKLSTLGADLLLKTLPGFLAGQIKPQSQDNSKATYTKILTKQDGQIDWSKNDQEILNQIRAFNPWPGAFSYLGDQIFKIIQAQSSAQKLPSGKIIFQENMIYIGTSTQAIQVDTLQLAGGKPLSSRDFISGHQQINGALLASNK